MRIFLFFHPLSMEANLFVKKVSFIQQNVHGAIYYLMGFILCMRLSKYVS